jgi:hypothetical protein
MLVAEDMDGFQSCSLDGVNYMVAHYLNLDGLPLGAERMLRNHHPNLASRNTFFSILHSVVLGRLSVEEQI